MNALIVVLAQDALYALVVVAGLVWLTLDRSGKGRMAAEGLLGLALVGAGIWLAGHLHTDPRPFVSDPASSPLFAHPADNGFPSDHGAAAALLAAVVFRYRRALGALLGVGAALIAWARVAAHVHHAQDVIAGLGIGLAAAALAVCAVHLVLAGAARRGHGPQSRARTAAGGPARR